MITPSDASPHAAIMSSFWRDRRFGAYRVADCQQSALLVSHIQVWRDQGQQGWESKSAEHTEGH